MLKVKRLTAKAIMTAAVLGVMGIAGVAYGQTWNAGPSTNPEAVTATLSEGTLTVSKQGAAQVQMPMMDYHLGSLAPWHSHRDSIKAVVITDGVRSIGSYAFKDHSKLTSITISSGVTEIGNNAFDGCTGLDSVTLGYDSYCSKDPDAPGCTNLFYLTVGSRAFANCYGLTHVTINGVTTLEYKVFEDCKNLRSIAIGKDVRVLEKEMLSDSPPLISIDVSPDSDYFSSCEDGVLFNKNKTTLVLYPQGKEDTVYTVPVSVDSIGRYAFENTLNLRTVIISSRVTSIGYGAFDSKSLNTVISLNPVPPRYGDYLTAFGPDMTNISLYVPQASIEDYRSEWEHSIGANGTFKEIKAVYSVTFNTSHGLENDIAPASLPSAKNPSVIRNDILSWSLLAGEGNKLTRPADPVFAGYNFGGWYRLSGESNSWLIAKDAVVWDFDNDVVTSDITLYAKWDRVASVHKSTLARANSSLPSVSVRGRTLNVKLPASLQSSDAANMQVRMIDMRGRTVSNFKITGGTSSSFALKKIPAGSYIVEVRNAKARVSTTPVMIR